MQKDQGESLEEGAMTRGSGFRVGEDPRIGDITFETLRSHAVLGPTHCVYSSSLAWPLWAGLVPEEGGTAPPQPPRPNPEFGLDRGKDRLEGWEGSFILVGLGVGVPEKGRFRWV